MLLMTSVGIKELSYPARSFKKMDLIKVIWIHVY